MIEGLGQDNELLCGKDGIFGFQGFIDAGDDDGGIAGVFARGIDGVFVPGAVG